MSTVWAVDGPSCDSFAVLKMFVRARKQSVSLLLVACF